MLGKPNVGLTFIVEAFDDLPRAIRHCHFNGTSLLKPYPVNDMAAYPVSKAVDSPAKNEPGLIEPVVV